MVEWCAPVRLLSQAILSSDFSLSDFFNPNEKQAEEKSREEFRIPVG